jgi:hypothetical protein
MNISVTQKTPRYTPRSRGPVGRWLHRDNRPRWTFFVTGPRAELAYALSNIGAAISRLGHRLHDDAPGDYTLGHYDGQQVAALMTAARPRVTREQVRALLASVDLPHDDATLDALGWRDR